MCPTVAGGCACRFADDLDADVEGTEASAKTPVGMLARGGLDLVVGGQPGRGRPLAPNVNRLAYLAEGRAE